MRSLANGSVPAACKHLGRILSTALLPPFTSALSLSAMMPSISAAKDSGMHVRLQARLRCATVQCTPYVWRSVQICSGSSAAAAMFLANVGFRSGEKTSEGALWRRSRPPKLGSVDFVRPTTHYRSEVARAFLATPSMAGIDLGSVTMLTGGMVPRAMNRAISSTAIPAVGGLKTVAARRPL